MFAFVLYILVLSTQLFFVLIRMYMESIYHMVVTLLSMQCLKVSLKLTVHYHEHWLGKVSSLFINWSFFNCSSEMPQRFRCIKNSGKKLNTTAHTKSLNMEITQITIIYLSHHRAC